MVGPLHYLINEFFQTQVGGLVSKVVGIMNRLSKEFAEIVVQNCTIGLSVERFSTEEYHVFSRILQLFLSWLISLVVVTRGLIGL